MQRQKRLTHTFYVDDRTPTVMLEIYKVVPILKKLPFEIDSLHAHGQSTACS